MDLSIIVPLYYKEDSVQPLYEAITKPIAVTTAKYEILLIDDGSKDKTFNILSEICSLAERLRTNVRRPIGRTTAI